jgi:hypothetical protein
VGHNLADLDVGEVQDAAKHVTLVLLHRARLGVQRDGAAERVERGGQWRRLCGHAE